MKRFLFNPHVISLPKRSYDITKYANYIDHLNGKEREGELCCHCFALFNEEQIKLVQAYLEQHEDCECYCEPIYEEQLTDLDD